jgi:hypothetical protein
MIDKLRKNAAIAGFSFFLLALIGSLFDSAYQSETIQNAIEPFTVYVFGDYSGDISSFANLLYFIVSFVFYLMAWKGAKNTFWMFFVMYGLSLFVLVIPWHLQVENGLIFFLGYVSCVADGVILCCLLLSESQSKADRDSRDC